MCPDIPVKTNMPKGRRALRFPEPGMAGRLTGPPHLPTEGRDQGPQGRAGERAGGRQRRPKGAPKGPPTDRPPTAQTRTGAPGGAPRAKRAQSDPGGDPQSAATEAPRTASTPARKGQSAGKTEHGGEGPHARRPPATGRGRGRHGGRRGGARRSRATAGGRRRAHPAPPAPRRTAEPPTEHTNDGTNLMAANAKRAPRRPPRGRSPHSRRRGGRRVGEPSGADTPLTTLR